MDFRPTETQILIADTVASLVDDHVQTSRGALEGDRSETSSVLWSDLAQLGLLGAEIEEAQGGSGGSFEDLAIILQGLGRAGGAGAFIPVVVMAAGLISRFGDTAQKATLAAIVEGHTRIVPAGFDAVDTVSTQGSVMSAAPVDGGWILTGRIAMVPSGDVADHFIVKANAVAGPMLLVLPAETEGLLIHRLKLYDGTSAAHLQMNACRVPIQARLGGDASAAEAIDWAADRASAAFANEAVGLMQALCDLTLDYIRTRKQFGQTLGSFQVVQHRMVDMRIELELARSMAILAAVAADDPDRHRRMRDIAAARAAIGKASRIVGQSAIQLHGAIALTQDYPAGTYVKRLTLIERAFGDTDWHIARFASLS